MLSDTTNRRAVTLIEEIEERLVRLRGLLGQESGTAAAPDAGDQVLADVLEQGAAVTREELYAIAAKRGMDRRGLGGFFRETGKKSLTELPGTGRIVLTPYGAERAQRALNRRAPLEYTQQEPQLHRIAESSFAEDWNSPEDDIYDRA